MSKRNTILNVYILKDSLLRDCNSYGYKLLKIRKNWIVWDFPFDARLLLF